jgi:hypothetical protein
MLFRLKMTKSIISVLVSIVFGPAHAPVAAPSSYHRRQLGAIPFCRRFTKRPS